MWWGFALQDIEFTRVSYQDLLFTFASIIFVWVYITVHTGSCFIGMLGMMEIILTLPIALFFYKYVFGITFFNQVSDTLEHLSRSAWNLKFNCSFFSYVFFVYVLRV